jgi:hypothetical protein
VRLKIQLHGTQIANAKKKKYVCKDCGMEFKTEKALKDHRKNC